MGGVNLEEKYLFFRSLFIKFIEKVFYFYYFIIPKKEIDYKNHFKKILLISTKPNGIGDLIMDTPFIKTIRKAFPNSKIYLVTDKDIFDKVKEIDKIILINEKSKFRFFKKLMYLRKKKYDLGIIMNRGINQTIYLNIISPKYKLGYLAGWKIVSNFRLKKNNLEFTKNEHYWNMALKIACSLGIENYDTELITVTYSKEVREKVKKVLKNLKLNKTKKTIIINPFVLWETRQWDKDNYIRLIEKIYCDFNIVLYGGPDSLETVKYIQNKLKGKNILIKSVAGKLKLKESIYFLKFADLFITSDCGPMHFAFLMKTPTLALFGPTKPYYYLPKNFKKYGIYDYLWYNDFKKMKKFYNYEYKFIDKKINGLKAIPVIEVKKKIYKFFENGEFY